MVEFVSHIMHSKSHDSCYSYIYIYIAKGRLSYSLAINRITVVKKDCMLTFVCAVSSVMSDSL